MQVLGTQLGAIFAVFLLFGAEAAAVDRIRYELTSYGVQYVVLKLTGNTAAINSITPTEDKQLLRITGSDVQFAGVPSGPDTPLIKHISQVGRGRYTDLLVNFSVPCDVSSASGKNTMQVTIKGLTQIPGLAAAPAPSIAPPTLRFAGSKEDAAQSPHGLTIVLPDKAPAASVTKLGKSLQWLALASDLSWQWLIGQESSAQAAAQKIAPDSASDSEALSRLVNELSSDLATLREQIKQRDQELADLRSAANEASAR